MTEIPVACTLGERELAECRAGLLTELRRHRQEVCPFLRFRLTVEPAGGPVWLELTGPAGTREFLAAEIGRAHEATPGRA